MLLIIPTAIVSQTRKIIAKMANPIADSAPATIVTNEENTWLLVSSEEMENAKKFEFTANNIDSIGIDIIEIIRLCYPPKYAL